MTSWRWTVPTSMGRMGLGHAELESSVSELELAAGEDD
jgi:hypothetical protein